MTAPADLERARFNMIEQQIRPWDVLDLDVLALLQHLKRNSNQKKHHPKQKKLFGIHLLKKLKFLIPC